MEEGVDRADAMRNLTEALGGKLLSFYGMVGQYYHVMAISEVSLANPVSRMKAGGVLFSFMQIRYDV